MKSVFLLFSLVLIIEWVEGAPSRIQGNHARIDRFVTRTNPSQIHENIDENHNVQLQVCSGSEPGSISDSMVSQVIKILSTSPHNYTVLHHPSSLSILPGATCGRKSVQSTYEIQQRRTMNLTKNAEENAESSPEDENQSPRGARPPITTELNDHVGCIVVIPDSQLTSLFCGLPASEPSCPWGEYSIENCLQTGRSKKKNQTEDDNDSSIPTMKQLEKDKLLNEKKIPDYQLRRFFQRTKDTPNLPTIQIQSRPPHNNRRYFSSEDDSDADISTSLEIDPSGRQLPVDKGPHQSEEFTQSREYSEEDEQNSSALPLIDGQFLREMFKKFELKPSKEIDNDDNLSNTQR